MKALLLATITASTLFASCTQLNAGDNGSGQKIRNQGCYNQIDAHKELNGEPTDTILYNSERTLAIQLWYDTPESLNIYSFEFDRLNDVCNLVTG